MTRWLLVLLLLSGCATKPDVYASEDRFQKLVEWVERLEGKGDSLKLCADECEKKNKSVCMGLSKKGEKYEGVCVARAKKGTFTVETGKAGK